MPPRVSLPTNGAIPQQPREEKEDPVRSGSRNFLVFRQRQGWPEPLHEGLPGQGRHSVRSREHRLILDVGHGHVCAAAVWQSEVDDIRKVQLRCTLGAQSAAVTPGPVQRLLSDRIQEGSLWRLSVNGTVTVLKYIEANSCTSSPSLAQCTFRYP